MLRLSRHQVRKRQRKLAAAAMMKPGRLADEGVPSIKDTEIIINLGASNLEALMRRAEREGVQVENLAARFVALCLKFGDRQKDGERP